MSVFKPRRVVQHTVGEFIDQHLQAIKELFPDGKLTLVIRSPSLEGAVIYTNDQAHDVIAAIQSHGLKAATTVMTRQ